MHELTLRADGRAEMAFVGETPWHSLGQPIPLGAPPEQCQKAAGMDWEALEGVAQVAMDDGHVIDFPEHKGLYRSDTLAPLSIVGEGYQVVQPKACYDFFHEMLEAGGWHIHTAGTLRGGRKLWVMASNSKSHFVGPKKLLDEVMENVLFATSLDGSMKTTVALTPVRVVCANTMAIALAGSTNQVRISHRSTFDARAVQKTLGVAVDSFDLFMHRANELADTPIKLDEAREVLQSILDPKAKERREQAQRLAWLGDLKAVGEAQAAEVEDNRVLTGVLDLFAGMGMGANMKTAKGTRWGLLNAVTQYVDHAQGRTDETRLDSAWFGRGALLKSQTFEALTA